MRSYNQQIKALRRLCDDHHISTDAPFSDTDVCFLLQEYAKRHRVTTVPLFLSAVQYFARQQWSVEYVIDKSRQLHETQVALRRKYSTTAVSVAKVPITLADLAAFHATLDRQYFEHARTWCAALLAFFGLLRIGEYCDGSLLIGDVSAQPYGLDIVIRRSKTSAQPVRISLAARPDELCPVAALRRYSAFFLFSASLPARATRCSSFVLTVEGSSRPSGLSTSSTTYATSFAASSRLATSMATPAIRFAEAVPPLCCRPASRRSSYSATGVGSRTLSSDTSTRCLHPRLASCRRRRSSTHPSALRPVFRDLLSGEEVVCIVVVFFHVGRTSTWFSFWQSSLH